MDPAVALEEATLSNLKAIEEASAPGDSAIQQFYDNITVFLTGGSGFIGKQLIEKLFRSCNIKKMYVLMRVRKEKTVQERLKDILQDPVFDAVKKSKPRFEDRIAAVEGDIADIRLGICDQDWRLLTEEVEVIFHVAATTKFNENLRDAAIINVRGTREALQLAKDCRKLRSFVHVSTAYSHATSMTRGGEVLERFHPSPLPPETLIHMAETIERGRLEDITPGFIKGWPNTYCFTKAVAEEQVKVMAEDLPVCIVRPSIVISSYREPCPAWLDLSCSYSASGFIIGSGLGLNHVFQSVKDTDVSLVPVDYVNNALIAAAWDTAAACETAASGRETAASGRETATSGRETAASGRETAASGRETAASGRETAASGRETAAGGRETAIYNMVTSTDNKILWSKLQEYFMQTGATCPTPLAVWNIFVFNTSSYPVFLLLTVILHFIPAAIVDGLCLVVGREARFVNLYKKIFKLSISLSYFMMNIHKLDDKNLSKLKEKLSETDRKIFNFDMAPLDWPEMVNIWCLGVRKYILKDGLKDTDRAIKKQFWFGMINYVFLAFYAYIIWCITAGILKGIFILFS